MSPARPCVLCARALCSGGRRAEHPTPILNPAAILEVHEDFFLYKSGIYRHTPVAEGKGPKHQQHGTHSVKITG